MSKINDGGPELKPCPFCGPSVRKPVLHKDKGVKCHTCGAWGPAWEKPDGSEWNRRADLVPAPSVTVKPLEWADLGDGTFRALLPIIGSIRVEPYGCCDWWEVLWSMPGQCDKLIPDVFDSPDDAKAAAQADYEARILAAVQIGPRRATPEALASLRAGEGFATSGAEARWIEDMKASVYDEDVPNSGWQHIETAPVGIPVLSYCYGGEVLMTRINKNREDEYARNPDLWMPIPKPPTKESAND